MPQVILEHNDDIALDPADPQLVMRGTVLLDGRHAGSWEARKDGSWTAVLADGRRFGATSREGLASTLAHEA
jgi:hypothetical protein